MPRYLDRSPEISVHLYKTIQRKVIAGGTPVSERYQAQADFIDLTPFLGDGSSVVTHKSVREPAGAFSITFPDLANKQEVWTGVPSPVTDLESLYALIEPMDVIEIRMWGGPGPSPAVMPIKMRGFVSKIDRTLGMSDDGKPTRSVVVSGQDYGKIWQTFQVLHLAAYIDSKGLLSTFQLWEMFGGADSGNVENTLRSDVFVREMIGRIINPHIRGFVPKDTPLPKELILGDGISVRHGVVNQSYQNSQGSIYDAMKFHCDVGIWNELYTEDREDGVHVIYRPSPLLHITPPPGSRTRKIQDDAPDPVYVEVPDGAVKQLQVSRSDANVSNYYWVSNSRLDLISDISRRMASLSDSDDTVNLSRYPNAARDLYGARVMMAETQQAQDATQNLLGSPNPEELIRRNLQSEDWINRRRRLMVEMNKDNVVFEDGMARVRGGLMRADGSGPLRAGDYARFLVGTTAWDAYVVSITDEYLPYQGYTASLTLERGEGFISRSTKSASFSPWLAEQARRGAAE